MAKAMIEPGHGKNTWPPSKGTNASGGVPGMAEHDFNAAVTDEAHRLLKGKLATYSAQPSQGYDVPLSTRTSKYNAEYLKDKTAIGMSNHGNANGDKAVKGFGVFYWKGSTNGKKLAQMTLAAYKKEFPGYPIWGSGIFESKVGDWTNFAILRDTAAPFILIEWDFFTNDESRKRMLTTDYRKRCGKVAAKVACDWYGIKFEEETPVVKPPVVTPASPNPAPTPAWKLEFDKQFAEAKNLGITDGTRRTESVTREEAAVMNVRAVQVAVDKVLAELKK